MNKLMTFEGNEVEVIELNGAVYFNPKHVGACLDITDVNSSIRDFTEKQVVKLTNLDMHTTHIRKLNNAGENFLTESGVYKLIFKSRKESAERFQDWVTDEVLPSIRQNGGYIAGQENLTPEQIVANALVVAQNIIANQNKEIETMKPKAEFHDAVVGSDDTVDMSQVAKILNYKGIGRNKLFEILRKKKVLRHNNEPMQAYVDRGWFRQVESKYQTPSGETRINIKTVVFQKGVDGIRKILDKG